ncbi:MAG: YceI family protein [Anaerolineae bacterium]|nr:YceI family protein [Promineifilum sp.]MCZ2114293.1 YceI family protein [Anaerolineae bacterium]
MAWQLDKSHTHINFTARHMMISKVRGEFTNYDINVNFDEENPTQTTVDVTIYADSISTRDDKRDAHLRSADFFDVDTYPVLTFKSTKVEQINPNKGRLIGDLTIRDVTHEVTLDVDYAGLIKSPFGSISAGFSAETSISRKDWGLNWNVALETGGWLVSDKIDIEIELELVQVPEAVAEQA